MTEDIKRLVEAFTVLKTRELRGELCACVGETVYRCAGYDYGCASDDTRGTGILHISVTKDPTGDYPFFTIPLADLAPFTKETDHGEE